MEQQHSVVDTLILQFDQGLRTLFATPQTTGRAYPAAGLSAATLTAAERRQVAGFMRVNHTGEVCAQALYQGQALTAKTVAVRDAMQASALEENDHLAWCGQRLVELGSRPSYLNVWWYCQSLLLGALAGSIGDKWSLGFIVETERQVVAHLQAHLAQLPAGDQRSTAILQQMITDEQQHATQALAVGGVPLPGFIRKLMRLSAKVMTSLTTWI